MNTSTSLSASNLLIDRAQASKHLEYLGYRPGDNVYLRFFYHSSDPRKNNDRGRKESLLSWEQVEKYQSDGRGVYVVVNGSDGGHTDTDIKQCCAIFCEWDDISLAEQFEKWSELGFVEPTFTVYSGDKSMQPYWVFDEPITPKQWRELQNLLIEVMKADKSNKNPSRVFRLAGGWHVKPDASAPLSTSRISAKTEIVGESGIRYNFMDLQSRLVNLLVADTSRTIVENQLSTPLFVPQAPELVPQTPELVPQTPELVPQAPNPKPQATLTESSFDYSEGTPIRYKDITVPVPIEVPIECALGKSKDFLSGVAIERNTSMATLARDLIGVQTEYSQLGQSTNDDAYTLFIDACRRCSPGNGWDEHEWEQIWASAVRSNPTASISKAAPDAVKNCIRAWYWNNHLKWSLEPSNRRSSDNPLNLETEIDELLTQELKESQLQIKILGIAQKYRISSKELLKIYELLEGEKEQETYENEKTALEVAKLLASKSASLKISEILPETLAAPIEKLATTLNLKPEAFLLALLVQSGSLLKTGTSTMLYPQSQFRCGPNYFGALVAESSQKKTPIVRAIISDPMEKILVASEQEYQKACIAYEEDLNHWKNNKDTDKGSMPIPPTEKVYFFTKATSEGITAQAQKLPEQSMLYLCDELAGAFKSANQYRGGKGSDEEDLLEYWSGGGAVVLRVGGLATNVRHVGLSIFGNIQPKVLAGFIGDGDDNNGKFARFDFVQQPLSATELFEDAPNINLSPMLTAIYERLDALPPQKFELERAARKLFIRFYNHCEKQRIFHPKQGMRAMWGKAPLKVGKIATILHCLHAAHLGIEISPNITIKSVRSAIKFVKFTTDQALSLNLEICESTELAPNLAKIVFLADRKQEPIRISEIRQSFNSKYRPTTGVIRQWFGQLVAMGYGLVDAIRGSFSLLRPQRPQRPENDSNAFQEPVENVHTNVHTNVHNVQTEVCPDSGANVAVVGEPENLDVLAESGRENGRENGRSKPIEDKGCGENVDVLDVVDVDTNEELTELVTFIQRAIAEGDRELAEDIQGILKEACKTGVDRKQVWEALTNAEQVAFTALVRLEQNYAHRILSAIKCGSKAVARAIELDLKHDIDAGNVTEAAVAKIVGQSFQEFKNLVALIAPIDAEKIRDIALIFWDEYYPEHTQSLITQMFGSKSPGTRYSEEIIYKWLETEDELVRDRISQLFILKDETP